MADGSAPRSASRGARWLRVALPIALRTGQLDDQALVQLRKHARVEGVGGEASEQVQIRRGKLGAKGFAFGVVQLIDEPQHVILPVVGISLADFGEFTVHCDHWVRKRARISNIRLLDDPSDSV